MKKTLLLIAAGLLSVTVSQAVTEAYSPPVGGNLITLNGAVSGVPKITTFSLALRLPVSGAFVGRARGTLTGVSLTSFTDSQAGWSAGALSVPSAPYFIRIRSGAAAGTWWQISTSVANTASVATILNRGIDPAAIGITTGDQYEIVPGDTLANLFGGLAGTIGGVSAATADAVRIHDGVSWKEYYYNTTVSKWREGAATFDKSNTVIRPDSGVVYVRRAAGNVSFAMLGSVSNAQEQISVNPTGVTFVGSVFPVGRTLGSLNVQTMPGFVMNTGTLTAADKVTVFDGVSWHTYQYNSSVAQWREGAATFNKNNFALPFGAPIIIERGSGATGGVVFLNLQPPYSI